MSVQRNCLDDGIILMKAARKELEKGKNELFKVVVAEICRGRTSDIVPSYKEDARIRAGEKQHSRPESETIINELRENLSEMKYRVETVAGITIADSDYNYIFVVTPAGDAGGLGILQIVGVLQDASERPGPRALRSHRPEV